MSAVTVRVGTRFRSTVADCNVLWEVKKSRGRGVWDCVAVNEPVTVQGKQFESDYAGNTKVFSTKDITAALRLDKLFTDLGNANDHFYAKLEIGNLVHYDNGFGNYVRCMVVLGFKPKDPVRGAPEWRELLPVEKDPEGVEVRHVLRPLDLVGPWREYDLYTRDRSGQVRLGHYPRMIEQKELFAPNFTTIYEGRNRAGDLDPRGLPPVTWTPPPMSPEEEQVAALWRVVEGVQQALNENTDPQQALTAARSFLACPLPPEEREALEWATAVLGWHELTIASDDKTKEADQRALAFFRKKLDSR